MFGARLWPEAHVAEQRERMKGAMNALDNDGGLSAWAKRHPSTTAKSLAGMKEGLSLGAGTAAPGCTPCVLKGRQRALFRIGGIGRSIRTESAQLEDTNREQIVDLVHESRLGLS